MVKQNMQVSDAGFFKFVWPFSGHQTVKGQFNKSVYSLSLSTFKIYRSECPVHDIWFIYFNDSVRIELLIKSITPPYSG